MLRFLMRYLANNEKVVAKLADSRPIRRAAQFVVYLLTRTSSMAGTHKLPSDPKEFAAQLTKLAGKYADDIKKGISNATNEIKKK